jgi:hypothetical protein
LLCYTDTVKAYAQHMHLIHNDSFLVLVYIMRKPNWQLFWRKWSFPFWDILLAFAWRYWGNHENLRENSRFLDRNWNRAPSNSKHTPFVSNKSARSHIGLNGSFIVVIMKRVPFVAEARHSFPLHHDEISYPVDTASLTLEVKQYRFLKLISCHQLLPIWGHIQLLLHSPMYNAFTWHGV